MKQALTAAGGEETHSRAVYVHIRTKVAERERESTRRECGQTQRTRERLPARVPSLLPLGRRVERSVGGFSVRLRTPLGLVMRRLSADRDRERPAVSPMPPCTQRLCRIGQACARRFTTMGSLPVALLVPCFLSPSPPLSSLLPPELLCITVPLGTF